MSPFFSVQVVAGVSILNDQLSLILSQHLNAIDTNTCKQNQPSSAAKYTTLTDKQAPPPLNLKTPDKFDTGAIWVAKQVVCPAYV